VGRNFDRRPLVPDDAGDWAALLAAIQDADKNDEYTSEEDLLEEFGRPGEDFTRGSIAIYDGRTMVGYGVLTPRSEAGLVHDMRHDGGSAPGVPRPRARRGTAGLGRADRRAAAPRAFSRPPALAVERMPVKQRRGDRPT
jgi:mycothiol synthase